MSKTKTENPDRKFKDTKPELITRAQLDKLGLYHEDNKAGIIGRPDSFIPKLNICIFVDGCYSHACPECKLVRLIKVDGTISEKAANAELRRLKDLVITTRLVEAGYKVIRIWEHDILKKDFSIINYLPNSK